MAFRTVPSARSTSRRTVCKGVAQLALIMGCHSSPTFTIPTTVALENWPSQVVSSCSHPSPQEVQVI
jgi:hypothetical protein